MSRTDYEAALAEAMAARWPDSPLPAGALRQAATDLDDVPWDQALAAVHSLYLEGLDRAPTGATIRRRWAKDAVAAPTFDTAMAAVRQVLQEEISRIGRFDEAAGQMAARRLKDVHPMLSDLARGGFPPPRRLHGAEREGWRRRYEHAIRDQERHLLMRQIRQTTKAA